MLNIITPRGLIIWGLLLVTWQPTVFAQEPSAPALEAPPVNEAPNAGTPATGERREMKAYTGCENFDLAVDLLSPDMRTGVLKKTYDYKIPGSFSNLISNSIIGTDAPLDVFPRKEHPVSRRAVRDSDDVPVATNNFYTNLMIGKQAFGAFPLPYGTRFFRDRGNLGLGVTHNEDSSMSLGPNASQDPVQYYINPIDVRNFVFEAVEFGDNTTMTVKDTAKHSVNVFIHADRGVYGDETMLLESPLVQGAGFFTAHYKGLTPILASEIFFAKFEEVPATWGNMQKFKITLNDQTNWILYAIRRQGQQKIEFESAKPVEGQGLKAKLQAKGPFNGTFQLTKMMSEGDEAVLDKAAGMWPITMKVEAHTSGSTGNYTFSFKTAGNNKMGAPLVYALPHHIASFDEKTKAKATNLTMRSPSKGKMRGVIANTWTLIEEDIPRHIGWLPNEGKLSQITRDVINQTSHAEMGRNISMLSDLESMYSAGKLLSGYAQIVMAQAIANPHDEVILYGLDELKGAMRRFLQNKQKYPLYYDTTWKGVISSAYFKNNDSGVDFGNTHYNDHHFHYGYHVYAAAASVFVDRIINGNNSSWLQEVKPWTDMLVRDIASPNNKDKYFPESRSFDWYHGHSWAKGLFESGDGKDEESTSEDYHHAYSIKLWAQVTGDEKLEARMSLILGVMKRSFNTYVYMDENCVAHPKQFHKNLVAGILFENKADHATYFGMNQEFIHGIHMIPLSPMSEYMRPQKWVYNEWMKLFDDKVENTFMGWRGILWANKALLDPQSSWDRFTSKMPANFLDEGTSMTWYALWSGALRDQMHERKRLGLPGGEPLETVSRATNITIVAPWEPKPIRLPPAEPEAPAGEPAPAAPPAGEPAPAVPAPAEPAPVDPAAAASAPAEPAPVGPAAAVPAPVEPAPVLKARWINSLRSEWRKVSRRSVKGEEEK